MRYPATSISASCAADRDSCSRTNGPSTRPRRCRTSRSTSLASHSSGTSFGSCAVTPMRLNSLDALGPHDVLGDPIAKQYLWWLLDVWFIRNQPARGRSARRSRDRVAALAEARVQTYRDVIAVAMATTAGLGSGGRAFSFESFER